MGDGGIVFENPSQTNDIVNVFGGYGYGQGNRGGDSGNSDYWAPYGDPSGTLNSVTGVFTPESTYILTVTVVNGLFTLYKDPDVEFDSNSVALTSYSYPSLTEFEVGLYDDQPNATTGSGFGAAQSFSDFSVTGTPAVPEPPTWSMMLLGFVGLGFAGYRRAKKARITVAP